MTILLKELTLRYSPSRDTLEQLIQDYYAIYPLWKEEGSGAMVFGKGPEPEKRTEVIDQVFTQVTTMLAERLIKMASKIDTYKKIVANISHHLKMENWLELHAEMEKIIKDYLGNGTFHAAKNKLERDPANAAKKYGIILSPMIQKLVSTSKLASRSSTEIPTPSAEVPPKAPEPSIPTPAVPAPKADEPVVSIAPKLPPGIPPLGAPMAGKTPKRLKAMESELEKYGYKWSEEDQVYKNNERNVVIIIYTDNSALVKTKGNEFPFNNLGELFRKMADNRQRRHAAKAAVGAEPSAQLKEQHYKTLYNFLYR